jgi:hypothetical protein
VALLRFNMSNEKDKLGQKHYQSIVNGEDISEDEESEIAVRRINLNERLAEKMKQNGIDCEALGVDSLPIEHKPYYSYNFPTSPKFITNRGCISVKGRNIDLLQIIQRN